MWFVVVRGPTAIHWASGPSTAAGAFRSIVTIVWVFVWWLFLSQRTKEMKTKNYNILNIRVVRGGSWSSSAILRIQLATRNGCRSGFSVIVVGFRVAYVPRAENMMRNKNEIIKWSQGRGSWWFVGQQRSTGPPGRLPLRELSAQSYRSCEFSCGGCPAGYKSEEEHMKISKRPTHVVRGGSWLEYYYPLMPSASFRIGYIPRYHYNSVSFRVIAIKLRSE